MPVYMPVKAFCWPCKLINSKWNSIDELIDNLKPLACALMNSLILHEWSLWGKWCVPLRRRTHSRCTFTQTERPHNNKSDRVSAINFYGCNRCEPQSLAYTPGVCDVCVRNKQKGKFENMARCCRLVMLTGTRLVVVDGCHRHIVFAHPDGLLRAEPNAFVQMVGQLDGGMPQQVKQGQ